MSPTATCRQFSDKNATAKQLAAEWIEGRVVSVIGALTDCWPRPYGSLVTDQERAERCYLACAVYRELALYDERCPPGKHGLSMATQFLALLDARSMP